MKNIIFLLSLPRSGSTLLQRVLMAHNEITSISEPFIMLPFCYSIKKEGILAEYSHRTSYVAFEDFIQNLPNKKEDYYKELRKFALSLYSKQCKNNESFFLDKTPRYYLIIEELAKIFPDAKFIFLFRNPVHIFASILNTWFEGRLNKLYINYTDLYYGPCALSNGYEKLKDKAFAIKYEDFVLDPETHLKNLCIYLGIDYDSNMLENFSKQDTKGRLGDPLGKKIYKSITSEPLEKWKKTFDTPFRRWLIRRYIEKLPEECLHIAGYRKSEILEDIDSIKIKRYNVFTDVLDYMYATIVRITKANIFFGKYTKWARDKYID